MTEQQHPIKLLPGLVQLWRRNWNHAHGEFGDYLAAQAARWGADQELRACHELLDVNGCPSKWLDMLCAARRPKPPSLAEEALEVLKRSCFVNPVHENIIRHALVRLQELENHQ